MIAFKIEVFACITVILFISYAESFHKQWTKTNSWNEPSNWDPPRLPCPNDIIVLKDYVVYIEQNVTLKEGLNLRSDGEIIFGPNANLVFAEITMRRRRRAVSSDCVDSGAAQNVSFIGQHEKQWLNPSNWDVYKEGKKDEYMSKALPYIERVPCLHDRVSFPKGSAFEIDIADGITVKEVVINGEIITRNTELQSYLLTKEGKARFNFLSPGGSLNLNSSCENSGCLCRNETWREKICSTFTCPATCKRRVKPHNDCCYHCGALIDFTYYGNFDRHQCSKELRTHLEREKKYAHVRLYMSDSQHTIQILLSEDDDGSSAESAAEHIQFYINNDSSEACGGSGGTQAIVVVKKGKIEKDVEEISRGSIALAVILPILFVAVIIIIASYFCRKVPKIKKIRFDNDTDFSQYPGVNDVQMTTDFTSPAFRPGGMAFANPAYDDCSDQQERNVIKTRDVGSPEYAIPVDYISTKRIDNTHKPIEGPEVLHVEYTSPEIVVGVPDAMFDGDHTIEGHHNPLYSYTEGLNDIPEKLTSVGSVGDLDSTDDNMDPIKVKLELKLNDTSESEGDITDTSYNKEVGPGEAPPVNEKLTQDATEAKLDWKLKDTSDFEDGNVGPHYEEVGVRYAAEKGWVTDFDS